MRSLCRHDCHTTKRRRYGLALACGRTAIAVNVQRYADARSTLGDGDVLTTAGVLAVTGVLRMVFAMIIAAAVGDSAGTKVSPPIPANAARIRVCICHLFFQFMV